MTRARPASVPTEAKIPTNAVSGTQLGFPSESFETKPGPHEHTLAEQFPREFQTGCRHWKTHSGMEGSNRSTGFRLGAYGGLVSARPSSPKLVGPTSDSEVDQTVIIPPHISENAVTPHLRKRGGITLDDVSGLTHDSAHLFVLFITHTSRHSKGDKNVGSGWALNNMVISRRRSLRLAATGLCLHDHHRCTNAFGVSPTTRLAGRSVMRPSVTRVGSTVDVGRRNGVVDTAWTGTEVRRDRQTDRARERDVKKYWSCAVQTTRHEKFRACLGVCSVSEVRKHVWQDSSPSRLRCFEGGGHMRELYRLSWLGGEGVIVAQT